METVFWILIVALLVYEVVTLWFTPDPGDHITAIIRRLAKRPLVPFALGVLMGHLFWCW